MGPGLGKPGLPTFCEMQIFAASSPCQYLWALHAARAPEKTRDLRGRWWSRLHLSLASASKEVMPLRCLRGRQLPRPHAEEVGTGDRNQDWDISAHSLSPATKLFLCRAQGLTHMLSCLLREWVFRKMVNRSASYRQVCPGGQHLVQG